MTDPRNLPGLEAVASVVLELAERFEDSGHRLYLVGGVVRDLLLGRISADDDIDLTTDAHPSTIKDLVGPYAAAIWTQGERFGTIGATVNGRELEITTHRAEAYEPDSRKPIVAFGDSIEQDLERRDFTINAMAIALPRIALVDPHGGERDLAERRLVTPLSPAESFGDDPLRMLRAARFLPRFDLQAAPGLEAATSELAPRLAIVSVERVHDELERLLALDRPERGLTFLLRTGLLTQAFPALGRRDDQLRGIAVAAAAPTPLTRRAGLLAPLGSAGVKAALDRLRYPRSVVADTTRLIDALPVACAPGASVATVRRVVAAVGLDAMSDLRALARLVLAADGQDLSSSSRLTVWAEPPLFALYDETAEREDLGELVQPLSGRQIMDRLGIGPGPLIGEATAHLQDQRLEHGPLSEDEAYDVLDRWWKQRDAPPA